MGHLGLSQALTLYWMTVLSQWFPAVSLGASCHSPSLLRLLFAKSDSGAACFVVSYVNERRDRHWMLAKTWLSDPDLCLLFPSPHLH